jgi:hypothetical protein
MTRYKLTARPAKKIEARRKQFASHAARKTAPGTHFKYAKSEDSE